MHVLVTGAAGYLGSMLLDAFATAGSITRVTGVDLKPRPAQHANMAKLRWFQGCISEQAWVEAVRSEPVDVVVHFAYQIRQPYGRRAREIQHRSNVVGAKNVFDFALNHPHVHRLITLSTVSAYGAAPQNSVESPIQEGKPLEEKDYLYGRQKAEVEAYLRECYSERESRTHVVILRLASVSGPRGRFGLNRFGLVSTIAGRFPVLVAGRADWGRQYLHEDDAIDVVSMFAHLPPTRGLETFNVAPSDYASIWQLASLLGKRAIIVPAQLLRGTFVALWHGSRGAIATPRGAWKFLSYPIRVDGSRLASDYGYRVRYSSSDALLATCGRYMALSSSPSYSSSRTETDAVACTEVPNQMATAINAEPGR